MSTLLEPRFDALCRYSIKLQFLVFHVLGVGKPEEKGREEQAFSVLSGEKKKKKIPDE